MYFSKSSPTWGLYNLYTFSNQALHWIYTLSCLVFHKMYTISISTFTVMHACVRVRVRACNRLRGVFILHECISPEHLYTICTSFMSSYGVFYRFMDVLSTRFCVIWSFLVVVVLVVVLVDVVLYKYVFLLSV